MIASRRFVLSAGFLLFGVIIDVLQRLAQGHDILRARVPALASENVLRLILFEQCFADQYDGVPRAILCERR